MFTTNVEVCSMCNGEDDGRPSPLFPGTKNTPCLFKGGDRHLLDVMLTATRDLRTSQQSCFAPCDSTEDPDHEVETEVQFDKPFLANGKLMKPKMDQHSCRRTRLQGPWISGIYI